MENGSDVNIVSLEMDRDAEASSVLTVESSHVVWDESKPDECGGGVWTNETHYSYLDSLEKSFVRQLCTLLGREETRRMSRTRHVQSNSHKSTDQFTLLQNGCRQKVKRAYLEMSSEYTIGTADQEASGQNFIKEVGEKGYNSGVFRKRRREANYDDESSLNDQVVP